MSETEEEIEHDLFLLNILDESTPFSDNTLALLKEYVYLFLLPLFIRIFFPFISALVSCRRSSTQSQRKQAGVLRNPHPYRTNAEDARLSTGGSRAFGENEPTAKATQSAAGRTQKQVDKGTIEYRLLLRTTDTRNFADEGFVKPGFEGLATTFLSISSTNISCALATTDIASFRVPP